MKGRDVTLQEMEIDGGRRTQLSGYGLVFVSAVLFGTYGVWSREIGDSFGVFSQAWVRCFLACTILVPIAVRQRSFRRIERQDAWPWAWYLGSQAFCIVPMYYAFTHINIGTATLMLYASYVVTSYVVGAVALGERIDWSKWTALFCAAGGVMLVFGVPSGKFTVLGGLMAILNGIGSGTEVSLSKRLSQRYSAMQIVVIGWAWLLIPYLVISLAIGEKQVAPAFNHDWFAMCCFCICGSAGFLLAVSGYRFIDASIGSIIGLGEIIVGVFLGIALYKESLSPTIVAGMTLILFAGFLPAFVAYRAASEVPVDEPFGELVGPVEQVENEA